MRIVIANSSGVPIYEQIKDQLREAILTGHVAAGEALPSIRALARDLRVSVITTTRAYNDLEQEGYLDLIQGKGAYVRHLDTGLLREQLLRDVEDALAVACDKAALAHVAPPDLHTMLDQALTLSTALTPIDVLKEDS